MNFPIPKENRNDESAHPFCRWCGKELNDKRKRYCNHEHRDEWLNKIYFPEDFKRQRHNCLKRDNNKCQKCGMTSVEHNRKFNQDLHAHHKVPRSMGGSNYVDNLITLCRGCHIVVHKENGIETEWRK